MTIPAIAPPLSPDDDGAFGFATEFDGGDGVARGWRSGG
jgi:hypothetical protein